jgi:hydrogenase nickel incorporation protein HypA/HybF
MHELSIAQNIMEIVLKHVPDEVRIRSIKVAVGRLSGVIPESLEFCFGSVIDDTPLDGAQLEIERIPVKARCSTCNEMFTKDDDTVYICPACGSTDLEFITGTELKVVEVAIAEDEVP